MDLYQMVYSQTRLPRNAKTYLRWLWHALSSWRKPFTGGSKHQSSYSPLKGYLGFLACDVSLALQ